jgi:hypothetical protein
MITVKRYSAAHNHEWNTLVATSANGTFLLHRTFLEYHKNRFTDHSLLIHQNNNLIAVFPANEKGGMIYSHGGLTYGGLILLPRTGLVTVLSCFYALTKYYHTHKFTRIQYKPVPSFFHITPSYGDLYGLFLLNARLTGMNTGFILDMKLRHPISKHHERLIKKASIHNVRVELDRDCTEFWNQILVPHLNARFHTKPVHTLTEISLIQRAFPKHILQYTARIKGAITAGTTIFLDRGVAHTQYIAGNETARKLGSIDYLFWHLITHEFKDVRYFSFGTANMGSTDGRDLSRGLVQWKEKFGAVMVPYPCYEIETKNYRRLDAFA